MEKSLDFRKKKIEGASALSYSYVRPYALGFREHFDSLFDNCDKSVSRALNWKKLDMATRTKHAIKLVMHALKFKFKTPEVKVSVVKNDEKTRGTLGSCSIDGREIKIYESALARSHDELINTCAHEPEHAFQINGKSDTVSSDTVRTCTENYISLGESRRHYLDNPIEQGARFTGEIVSENFTAALRARNKRIKDWYQRAA